MSKPKDISPHDQWMMDLRVMMRTPEGRRFFGRCIDGVWGQPLPTGHSDQNLYNQGRTSVYMGICSELRAADLDAYHQIERDLKQEREDHG